jgi:hypothetical protein
MNFVRLTAFKLTHKQMKAEEIKFEILGIPYTKSTLTEMVKTYARIQIEKDRQRIFAEHQEDVFLSLEKVLVATPIILD